MNKTRSGVNHLDSNPLPSGKQLLKSLNLKIEALKVLSPGRKRSSYRAAINWILKSGLSREAFLNETRLYIYAANHLCDAEDWERAILLLDEDIAHKNGNKLRHILQPAQEQISLYFRLLDNVDQKWKYILLSGLSQSFSDMNKYEESIQLRLKSISAAKALKDEHGEFLELTGLANCYLHVGRYREAADIAQKIIKEVDKHNDEKLVSVSLGTIGDVFLALEKIDDCIKVREEKLHLAKKLNNERSELETLHSLGLAYRYKKDYSSFLKVSQSCTKLG